MCAHGPGANGVVSTRLVQELLQSGQRVAAGTPPGLWPSSEFTPAACLLGSLPPFHTGSPAYACSGHLQPSAALCLGAFAFSKT